MVHKLICLLPTVLFLGLFAMPALCARRMPCPRHLHHDQHQLHSSTTDMDPNNLHMVAAKEDESSMESPTFVRPPKLRTSARVADESSMNIEVPASTNMVGIFNPSLVFKVPSSTNMVGIFDPPLVSEPETSGCVSADPNEIAKKRALLDASSSSNDSLQGGEDLSSFLATLTTQDDHNLFNMLPRAHRVPPSGPSKSHNSELTDKPT